MKDIKWVSNDTVQAINTRHNQLAAGGDDIDTIIDQIAQEYKMAWVNRYDDQNLYCVASTGEYVAVAKDDSRWYNSDWDIEADDLFLPFSIFAIAGKDKDMLYELGVKHGTDDIRLVAWGCNGFPSTEGKGIVLALADSGITYANPDKDKRIKTIKGDNPYSDLDYYEAQVFENNDGYKYAHGWGGPRSLFGVASASGGEVGRNNAYVLLG